MRDSWWKDRSSQLSSQDKAEIIARMRSRAVTVAADGSGDFTTIADALGGTDVAEISVRPGRYDGAFELPDVSLRGDGGPTSVEIRSKARPCITARGPAAIRDLMLVAVDSPALEITSGSLLVDDCVLASVGAPAVVVSGALVDPRLTRCSIERDVRSLEEGEEWEGAPTGRVAPTADASVTAMKAYGDYVGPRTHPDCAVRITDGAQGRFLDCDVHVGAAPVGGVSVESGADPWFEHCRIGNADRSAINVSGAHGSFEECTINGQWWIGVLIEAHGDPIFRRCRIVGGSTGVSVSDARGTFQDCEITLWTYEDQVPGEGGPQQPGERLGGNGIEIARAGDPTIRNAWVHDLSGHALVLQKGAAGLVEGCRFERNHSEAISRKRRVKTKLERNIIE